MNYINGFIAVFAILLCSQISIAGGFDGNYEIYKGDANGDGILDLYIRQKPKIVLIHGNIITPITISPDVREFILMQDVTQKFSVEEAPSTLDLSQWQLALNIVQVVKDINLDGTDDLIIKNLSTEIPYMDDTIVYSNRQSNKMPSGTRAIDPDFKQFVNEVSSWIDNPNYFEENAPLVPVEIPISDTIWMAEYCANQAWIELYGPLENLSPIATIEGDTLNDIYDDNQYFVAQCFSQGLDIIHYDFVSVLYYETTYVKDYSGFNQNALQLSQDFNDIFEEHALDPNSQLADDLATWLEIILGAEFKPWIYYGDDGNRWYGVNINPYLNAKMVFTQLDAVTADEEDREFIESNQRAIANANINQAKELIYDDLRDEDLTLIDLVEGEVKDGFYEGIKITLVDSCGETAAACGRYNVWFGGTGPGTGVQNVEFEIVITAVQDIGDAIEVLAHELRHLSLYNRELGTPDPDDPDYHNAPAEVDARVEGRKVREYYGY